MMFTYKYSTCDTRCIGASCFARTIEWQLVQYDNGIPVARFKVKERI